jgi:flagellar basal body rod protein FlgG
MDNLSIAAVSGLRSRIQSLDLLANNLANANTAGFKADTEYYSTFASDDASSAIDGDPGTSLPVIQRQWTDFSSGSMEVTGNPLDIALSGKGFFALTGPNGPIYTRNGSLRILPTGELAGGDGYPIRSTGGNPIKVVTDKPIIITAEGQVQQDGNPLGQLEIVDFKNPELLQKVGSSAGFKNSDPTKNPPVTATAPDVQQGKLEGSNVVVAASAMHLVGIMRQFETLQKAIGISSDMDMKSIQEVAKV